LHDWLPQTFQDLAAQISVADIDEGTEQRIRRWYKHIMEFSPTARFPMKNSVSTISAWPTDSTTPDLPRKRVLSQKLTTDNAGWKRVLNGEFPVLNLSRGLPSGDHIPKGALWTANSTLLLIDPHLSTITVPQGKILILSNHQLRQTASALDINAFMRASVYHYSGVNYTRASPNPMRCPPIEHFFIGG
jgi:hypothetical protein